MPRVPAQKGTKKEENIQKNACCVYDFTMKVTDNLTVKKLRKDLKELCKKYCFQIEQGDKTGYLHYQGRFSLKEKAREQQVISKLKKLDWDGFHISVTSKENRDNNFYTCKDDTRVNGPYTDENDVFVPKRVQNMEKKLYAWQTSMLAILKTYEERHIHLVYDKVGNNGKSCFTHYMMCYENAEMLPCLNDIKDLLRMAYDVGEKDIYIFDMPRAINKDRLFQMYGAIETLKSGFCFDDRYGYRRRLMESPNLCIFTNVLPDLDLMSRDRWKIWCINQEMELVPFINEDDADLLAGEEPEKDDKESLFEELDQERKKYDPNGNFLSKTEKQYFENYCEFLDENQKK